jgi:hypothetical protein
MAGGSKKAPDRRVVIQAEQFAAAELLALSKICANPSSKVMKKARATIGTGKVYPVDVTVRVVGDIEVGLTEQVPDKISAEKYLVAALSMLSPGQRKRVLSRRPGGSRAGKLMAASELKLFKMRLPTHEGPAKLTPHLSVYRITSAGQLFASAAA